MTSDHFKTNDTNKSFHLSFKNHLFFAHFYLTGSSNYCEFVVKQFMHEIHKKWSWPESILQQKTVDSHLTQVKTKFLSKIWNATLSGVTVLRSLRSNISISTEKYFQMSGKLLITFFFCLIYFINICKWLTHAKKWSLFTFAKKNKNYLPHNH